MRSTQPFLSVQPWQPGQSLLETDRLAEVGAQPMQVLRGGEGDALGDLLGLFKPDKEDYKGLQKGLAFLKFTPSEAETLFNVIGSAANVAAGIVSVVGAVGAAVDVLRKLGILSTPEDPTTVALRQIGQRVEQIYGYLAGQERRGLHDEAVGWRVDFTRAQEEIPNLALSRTPNNLQTLVDRAAELDGALMRMLDAGSGRIAFLRAVYGPGHWIPVATSPYMSTAGGQPVQLREPSAELRSEIWDAGHYLDVLLRAIETRLQVAMVLEPAFRSTGYDRHKIASLATRVHEFARTWRSSLLVLDPAASITPDGRLHHPDLSAPGGIMIGAVDPVTGISSVEMFGSFPIRYERTDLPFAAWGGVWDESRAVDATAALAAAREAHARAVDDVVRACGLQRLGRLAHHLSEVGRTPQGSDIVRLPDARFRRPFGASLQLEIVRRQVVDEGTPVTVDLGGLKAFAADPGKTYEGRRYHQHGTKSFGFRITRRADRSNIQLGYTLRIGDEKIVLTRYGDKGPDFPSARIKRDVDTEGTVYDCHQSDHMSTAAEDRFERDGRVPGMERIFVEKRQGGIRYGIEVRFVPAPEGAPSHLGGVEVELTIRDPEELPDAYILNIDVLETRTGPDLAPEQVLADAMTVHMVPSYVVLGADYFADRAQAQVNMARTIKELDDRFTLQQELDRPPIPEPDPKWRMRDVEDQLVRGLDLVQAARELRGEVIDLEIARNLPPMVRR